MFVPIPGPAGGPLFQREGRCSEVPVISYIEDVGQCGLLQSRLVTVPLSVIDFDMSYAADP